MVDANDLPAAIPSPEAAAVNPETYGKSQADLDAQFAPKAEPAQAPAAAPVQSGEVQVFNPEGDLVAIPSTHLQQAQQSGYRIASPEEAHAYLNHEKYGGLGQQAINALEGVAEGATFGLSTGIETATGLAKPEDVQGRREEGPLLRAGSQALGVGLSNLIPGYGEANDARVAAEGAELGAQGVRALSAASVMHGAGEAGAEALGLGAKGSGFISQVGADTVKGAIEAAIFQGGDEVSRAFAQDPHQTAEAAIADIGLAGVMGGVFGGSIGAAMRKAGKVAPDAIMGASEVTPGKFISEIDRPAFEAGDFKASIENSDLISPKEKASYLEGLRAKKDTAGEIEAAAKYLGDAPILEGMVYSNKGIQNGEGFLLKHPETYSGGKRVEQYAKAYKHVIQATDDVLGPESQYSKAQLGNSLKQSLTKDLKEQVQPISEMYDHIKQYQEVMPIAKSAVQDLKSQLADLRELKLSPSSPEGSIAKRVLNEVEGLKTVDDIKDYRSMLNRSLGPGASSGERRIVGIIGDKFKDLEENSIERFAKKYMKTPEDYNKVAGLIEQKKMANAQYKDFITKVKTLSEQLGKGKVYGLQDALHFINERLTPEQVTQRLFAKNNSEFLQFFEKNFPEQHKLMQQYQKTALREESFRSVGNDKVFSPSALFDKVNKLEPEIQKSLFTAEELKKLKAAETYRRSFPGNFNPSDTSTKFSFGEFFTSPVKAASANARDLGIERFIKMAAKAPEIGQASSLGKSTVSGWNTASRAIKSVLTSDSSGSRGVMPAAIVASVAAREKLKKLVNDYTENPNKLLDIGASNPVPEYNEAFAATAARATQYLASIKPKEGRMSPLDPKTEPSQMEKATYDRQVDIAQQPLLVLKHLKDGTLIPQDLVTLKTIYPKLYGQLSNNLGQEMVNAVDKERHIPYATKLGLSLFMSQPLDSTMQPGAIQAAQPKPPQGQQPTAQVPKSGAKHSMNALNKLPGQYQTPQQAREAKSLKE